MSPLRNELESLLAENCKDKGRTKKEKLMISNQALQEFKTIYEREIGPAPDEKVLVSFACDLLTLMDVAYRPIKKEWIENANSTNTKLLRNN